MSIPTKQKGFTLVETLLYAVGSALLLAVIATSISYSYRWYRNIVLIPNLDQTAGLLIDRISRDIRAGDTLDSGQSVFNSASGSIGINALDVSKNPVTHYYTLQNGHIMYQMNGGTSARVSPANVTVSELRFTQIATPLSNAVRVTISIEYISNNGTSTNTYSALAIMRNSYQ